MRTTIDISDALYRRMKSTSALRGLNLKQFVTAAIERAIDSPEADKPHEVRLPLIRTGRTSTLRLTNAEIEDLLT